MYKVYIGEKAEWKNYKIKPHCTFYTAHLQPEIIYSSLLPPIPLQWSAIIPLSPLPLPHPNHCRKNLAQSNRPIKQPKMISQVCWCTSPKWLRTIIVQIWYVTKKVLQSSPTDGINLRKRKEKSTERKRVNVQYAKATIWPFLQGGHQAPNSGSKRKTDGI